MPRLALLLTTFIWGATFSRDQGGLGANTRRLSFLGLRFLLGTLLIGAWFLLAGYRLRRRKSRLGGQRVAYIFLSLVLCSSTVGLYYTVLRTAPPDSLVCDHRALMLRRFDGRVLTATAIATVGLWFLVKPSAT
jgi:hypothetical protein